jgi:hypothetical protein
LTVSIPVSVICQISTFNISCYIFHELSPVSRGNPTSERFRHYGGSKVVIARDSVAMPGREITVILSGLFCDQILAEAENSVGHSVMLTFYPEDCASLQEDSSTVLLLDKPRHSASHFD